jgi:hypothetical protein
MEKRLAAVGIVLAVALTACGSDDGETAPTPTGPLARALAVTGGGGANGSLGFGWADSEMVERLDAGPGLIADALGPNAETVIEQRRALRRRLDFDPLRAERFVSVGGSYAFGLRLDGVDGRGLAQALIEAGGRARQQHSLKLIEIGAYAVVPKPLLEADVNGLGAFDALGRDLSVLAISDRARSTLLGRGPRLIEEPTYAAAADCLGGVAAARMIPDKHLLSSELGINLVALGVGPRGEVLCVVGGSSERAAEIEAALRASLSVDSHDPVTGDRLADAIREVEIARASYEGVQVVRAQLTPAPGASGRYLFGTVATGSLVSLINGEMQGLFP